MIIKVACQLLNILTKVRSWLPLVLGLGLISDVMNTEKLLFAIQQPVWQFIQRILQLGLNWHFDDWERKPWFSNFIDSWFESLVGIQKVGCSYSCWQLLPFFFARSPSPAKNGVCKLTALQEYLCWPYEMLVINWTDDTLIYIYSLFFLLIVAMQI